MRVLLAPYGATVVGKDRAAIRTNGSGPGLNVRFSRLTQCCQDVDRRLGDNPYSPRGDLFLSAGQLFPHEFPQRKLGVVTYPK